MTHCKESLGKIKSVRKPSCSLFLSAFYFIFLLLALLLCLSLSLSFLFLMLSKQRRWCTSWSPSQRANCPPLILQGALTQPGIPTESTIFRTKEKAEGLGAMPCPLKMIVIIRLFYLQLLFLSPQIASHCGVHCLPSAVFLPNVHAPCQLEEGHLSLPECHK